MEQLAALPVDLNGASDRQNDDHERRVTGDGARWVDRVKEKLDLAISAARRHSSVAAVSHQHVAVTVEGDTDGIVELVRVGAFSPEHKAQKTSLRQRQLYRVSGEQVLFKDVSMILRCGR